MGFGVHATRSPRVLLVWSIGEGGMVTAYLLVLTSEPYPRRVLAVLS